MDVTCNRCSTIYEFDVGLVSPSGTTVKCTECGHLFKVFRPAQSPSIDSTRAASRGWNVRNTAGIVQAVESLADVIRCIGSGQFGADDEISRTGQVWKRLGGIAELAPLFESATARARRQSESSPSPSPGPAPERTRKSTPPELSSEEPRRTRRSSPIVELGQPRHAPAQAAPPLTSAADPQSDSKLGSSLHPVSIERPRSSAQGPVRATRSVLGLLSVLVALLIIGSLAAVVFGSARQHAALSDRVRSFAAQGDRALASHRPAGFAAALRDYEAALALAPYDTPLLSSISRSHAIWSQSLRTQLADMAQSGAPQSAEVAEWRETAQREARAAKRYAEQAVQLDPRSGAAGVAWSDALRLSGDLGASRAALQRARADGDADPAETLRVSALLAMDEAGGDAAAGCELPERAVAAAPGLLRTRLLLLHCLIETRALDAARAQLHSLRELDPTHPSLPALAARLAAESASQHDAPLRNSVIPVHQPTANPPNGAVIDLRSDPARSG